MHYKCLTLSKRCWSVQRCFAFLWSFAVVRSVRGLRGRGLVVLDTVVPLRLAGIFLPPLAGIWQCCRSLQIAGLPPIRNGIAWRCIIKVAPILVGTAHLRRWGCAVTCNVQRGFVTVVGLRCIVRQGIVGVVKGLFGELFLGGLSIKALR